MSYLVLSYPQLSSKDFQLIQEFRKAHDRFYSVVAPHFTIVFPIAEIEKENFISEVTRTSQGLQKFDFTIRHAIINRDSLSDYFHVFLQPQEGYNNFVKLHDQLYSGLFSPHLHRDIPFIPHITIGNSKDKFEWEKMVEEWNTLGISIKGHVTHLTIAEYQHEKINMVAEIVLK